MRLSLFTLLGCLCCSQAVLATDGEVLSICNLAAQPGTTTNLEVTLNNSTDVRALEFYVTLPPQMTFAMNNAGTRYDYGRERLPKGFTVIHKTPVGMESNVSLITIYVFSTTTTIPAGAGTLITLPVNIPTDMTQGYYDVELSQVIVTMNDGSTKHTALCSSTLAVSPYRLGDADTNGTVNAYDVSAIARHVLGFGPNPFAPIPADANIDRTVNVGDILAIKKKM